MLRILISTSSFNIDNVDIFKCYKKKYKITFNPFGRKLTPAELLELACDANGIVAGTEAFDRSVLEKLPRLKVISRCGAGIDNIDLKTAERLGIKVYSTPDGPTLAVAELTIGLMINLLRRISLMDREIRHSVWKKRMGSLLSGRKVGIIGFGRIGRKLADLLMPFGVKIAYYDISVRFDHPQFIFKPLQDLLAWADIITVHCSVSKDTKRIIGKDELHLMKKGAYLINTSRGGLVDEEALYDSLKSGHLSGAALDVFEEEPYDGNLIGIDNVILTPHIGSYAEEARVRMERQAMKNLLKGLMRLG